MWRVKQTFNISQILLVNTIQVSVIVPAREEVSLSPIVSYAFVKTVKKIEQDVFYR